jgi:hypothetical protein
MPKTVTLPVMVMGRKQMSEQEIAEYERERQIKYGQGVEIDEYEAA